MTAIRTISGTALALIAMPAAMAPAQAPVRRAPRIVIVPPCAAPDFPGWGRNHAGPAPVWLADDPTPELLLGDTVYLRLRPIAAVPLAIPLGKPAQPGDRGGLLTVRVAAAGTYRVALGARAWIDVVRDGKPVASIAHKMGEACSGIAKMVDFRLDPGSYTIQLSAAADPTLRIAIARLP